MILTLRVPEAGVFNGSLLYDGNPIQNGTFEIISLSSSEANAVQKSVVAKSPNIYYEGKLLAIGKEVQAKLRKIYVTVSTKQLVVKEYFLKLLPIRVATFRLSPNTKVGNIIRFDFFKRYQGKISLIILDSIHWNEQSTWVTSSSI